MLDISLPVANLLYGVSNVALVLGGVLALTGTLGTVWTSGIKERFADERTKANEAETERAKAGAATAHAEAAKANAEAAKANESTEILRSSNLALQAEVERERTARLQLESKLAPRHLSEAQKAALIRTLTPLAGSRINIVSPLGDAEAKTFANDFVAVFRAAGWNLGDSPAEAAYSGPHPRGIEVTINEASARSNRLPRGANELLQALFSLGLIPKAGFVNPQVPADVIDFRVGSKHE